MSRYLRMGLAPKQVLWLSARLKLQVNDMRGGVRCKSQSFRVRMAIRAYLLMSSCLSCDGTDIKLRSSR
jgi:hypothetical protein